MSAGFEPSSKSTTVLMKTNAAHGNRGWKCYYENRVYCSQPRVYILSMPDSKTSLITHKWQPCFILSKLKLYLVKFSEWFCWNPWVKCVVNPNKAVTNDFTCAPVPDGLGAPEIVSAVRVYKWAICYSMTHHAECNTRLPASTKRIDSNSNIQFVFKSTIRRILRVSEN